MGLIGEVGRTQWKVRLVLIGITAFLWLGVTLHLFPIYWSIITSLKEPWEAYIFPPTWWPKEISISGYRILFLLGTGKSGLGDINLGGVGYPLIIYLKNTFIIVAGTMAIQIPVCIMVAYALSKLHSPRWNRILFLFLIGPLLVPMVANLIPMFLLISRFPFATKHIPNIPFTNIPFPYVSLKNSFWAIILPTGFSAFNTLLLKGFFDSIPDELINAARLDGASELGIIRRVILPLSKPVLAVVSYFTFSIAYNNFLWPLIVLREQKVPISVYMYRLIDAIMGYGGGIKGVTKETAADAARAASEGASVSWPSMLAQVGLGPNAIMAISLIQSIPVFIMFIIFREQLMKGIKLRGFK